MLDLLQVACLMAYLWPKLEAHLGKGKALDDVQRMWQLGNLGCIWLHFLLKPVYFGKLSPNMKLCSGI